LLTTDQRGSPRVGRCDVGAYEASGPLQVIKYASPSPVQAGSQLTYTIRVTNNYTEDLHTTITDTLPPHILPSGTITWTPIITAPGGVWTETIVVTVTPGYAGWLTNTVQATSEEGLSGGYTATTLSLAPYLEVTKWATPDPVSAGAQLTYTIRITNTGNVALNGIVTDTLPLHVMPASVQPWTFANLSPGNVWTQPIVITVSRGYSGTLTNRVQVTTREGAWGETQVIVNAIGYQVYLPILLK